MSARHQWRLKFRVTHSAEWLFGLFLACADALVLNAIFINTFTFWLQEHTSQLTVYLTPYVQVRSWLFALYLGFGIAFGLFSIRALRGAADTLSHAAGTLLSTFVTFNLLISLWRPLALLVYHFPRPIILLSTGFGIVGVFLLRVLLMRFFIPEPQLIRAVIVGDEAEGKRILKHFHHRGGIRCRLMGVFSTDQWKEVAETVVFHHVSEVIVTDPRAPLEAFWAQIFYKRRVEPHPFRVRVVFDPASAGSRVGLSSLEDLPLQTIPALPVSGLHRLLKRGFDIAFSLFAILISSPVMILAALAVRLDSPGPIFYKQRRVGRYGKEFDVIKFRSMYFGAEKASGPVVATADDPRTTRIGRLIRKLGIDELPQFFLVLTGDMSVVGPRPERPYFVEQHPEFQGRRLAVRPGVTGLAAVNARYYLRLTDKVAYDTYYLDNYHLILDIKIVFQTVWVLLFESEKALHDKHHPLDHLSPPPDDPPEKNA